MTTTSELWLGAMGGGEWSEPYLHMERFVNGGSPSGFGLSSRDTRVLESLRLPMVQIQRELVTVVGQPTSWAAVEDEFCVPVHPDFIPEGCEVAAMLDATPTSSLRTVTVTKPSGVVCGWLKLHYPVVIGRFSRDLFHFKWLASLESSRMFVEAAANSSAEFWVLPEPFGWFCEVPGQRSFGVLGRVLPTSDFLAQPLVPAFSMISFDVIEESPLAILRSSFGWSWEQVAAEVGGPLVAAYVDLACNWGLLPECNAQNVLFRVDLAEGEVRPVFRDMGDVFRDLTVIRDPEAKALVDYKRLDWESPDLFERRSFSYDFKLGSYILDPLCEAIASLWGVSLASVKRFMKDLCLRSWEGLEVEYFSSSDWFAYPSMAGVDRNSYVRHRNPSYR